jgi:hypothetical protein
MWEDVEEVGGLVEGAMGGRFSLLLRDDGLAKQ